MMNTTINTYIIDGERYVKYVDYKVVIRDSTEAYNELAERYKTLKDSKESYKKAIKEKYDELSKKYDELSENFRKLISVHEKLKKDVDDASLEMALKASVFDIGAENGMPFSSTKPEISKVRCVSSMTETKRKTEPTKSKKTRDHIVDLSSDSQKSKTTYSKAERTKTPIETEPQSKIDSSKTGEELEDLALEMALKLSMINVGVKL